MVSVLLEFWAFRALGLDVAALSLPLPIPCVALAVLWRPVVSIGAHVSARLAQSGVGTLRVWMQRWVHVGPFVHCPDEPQQGETPVCIVVLV